MSAQAEKAPPRRGLTAFRCGAVCGLALGLVVVGLSAAAVRSTYTPWNVGLISRGADVSRHAAATLELRSGRGFVTLVCRDACDDLVLSETSGDNSYTLDVLNTKGECIRCAALGYVTGGFDTKAEVGGAEQLKVRLKTGLSRDTGPSPTENAPDRLPPGARP
jgi:hypothetical protein